MTVKQIFLAAGILTLAAASCGGQSHSVARTPASTGPSVTTTAAPTSTSVTATARPHLTINPASGLKPTQTVLLKASGFSPGESLVVTECAAKGTSTGPGDCDLTHMEPVTADGAGKITLEFTVEKGPFGTNKIVCARTQPCLVSVTQATLSPTEEADAPISFS